MAIDGLGRQSLDLWPDAALVIDADGRIIEANDRLETIFGYPIGGLVGRSVEMLLPERLRDAHRWNRSRYAAEPVRRPMGAGLDLVGQRADGTEIAVDISLSPVRSEAGEFTLATVRDVSYRVQVEHALAQSELRFRSIFEDSPFGMATVDGQGRITVVNAALVQMLATSADQLIGRTFDDISTPTDGSTPVGPSDPEHPSGAGGFPEVADIGRPDRPDRLDGHRCFPVGDGDPRWGLVSTAPVFGGSVDELVVTIHDITESVAEQHRLAHLATHDQLTQLPNRAMLLDRLHLALSRAERSHSGVAVLYIDLDNFKLVNDTYGHAAGDAVLKTVAQRLLATIRPSDTAARVGGDEFIVCCEDLPADAEGALGLAQSIAWRLRVELDEPVEVTGTTLPIGASIGVALDVGSTRTADALIWEADTAMFRDKAARRRAPEDQPEG